MSGQSERAFVARHGDDWALFEDLLDALERTRGAHADSGELPARYRRLCQDLALARHRHYSAALQERLNALALRGHELLYRTRDRLRDRVARYVVLTIPRTVRGEWRLLLVASLVFFGPYIGMMLAVLVEPSLALSVLDAGTLAGIEEMYDPTSEHLLRQRDADSDVLMFGFYIRNNTGIGFRTFGSGALFGLGSIAALVFNGVYLGTVFGHLVGVGFAETLLSFVLGHSAPELGAIVLSGAGGMRLGFALLAPGRRSRAAALAHAAHRAVPLVWAAAGLFLVAAFIEAFWSSQVGVPLPLKAVFGGGVALLIGAWLLAGGRRHAL